MIEQFYPLLLLADSEHTVHQRLAKIWAREALWESDQDVLMDKEKRKKERETGRGREGERMNENE